VRHEGLYCRPARARDRMLIDKLPRRASGICSEQSQYIIPARTSS
jgi:hypothetical protein